MTDLEIRLATPDDIGPLGQALRALSADLRDEHRASLDVLAAACFGPCPSAHAMLALGAERQPMGAALFSPVFSTCEGAAGTYVSDLWVSSEMRGRGLGKALLRAVGRAASDRWQGRFLRLTVYADNAEAQVFYERLGFRKVERNQSFALTGAEMQALTGEQT